MASFYNADPDEAAHLRELFGERTVQVVFYDFDFPDQEDSHWESVVALDAAGETVRSMAPGEPRWWEVEEIAAFYGESVKFGIDLPPRS